LRKIQVKKAIIIGVKRAELDFALMRPIIVIQGFKFLSAIFSGLLLTPQVPVPDPRSSH